MDDSKETMLDFDQIKAYQKRRFVPEAVDLTKVDAVRNLYHLLLNRVISSLLEFENWLLDRSELEAAVDQQRTIFYILMTCQTDDELRANNYKNFIETIAPAIKPLEDQLNHKYLQLSKEWPLDEKRYLVYTRSTRTQVELFSEANVDLQRQVDVLAQEYQAIIGAMSVAFDGKERTLPEMSKFVMEPDRDLRERAWRATAQRRLKEKEKLDKLFDQMVALRTQIAQNAGYANYVEYKFRELQRFDYTASDCRRYHETIEQLLVPLWAKILEQRREDMRIKRLRPWDLAVDPLGLPALKPFERVDQLIEGCETIFNHVDPELGAQFKQMKEMRLLDLASRKGKAPGGYQSCLSEARQPFIFMNAVGLDSDVWTLLHEGGHAFHSFACRQDPLADYRHGPMEFNEVASMSMELLGGEHLAVFYNAHDQERAKRDHLEDTISVLIWVATVDCFQHWIYENPTHSALERQEAWLSIGKRFGSHLVDWQDLEEEYRSLWHRQLHIFEVPFYYIEYGIAQLGALQIWFNAQKDWKGALAKYRQALALGGSRPLPELFSMAGLKFDFSAETIAPIVERIKKELGF